MMKLALLLAVVLLQLAALQEAGASNLEAFGASTEKDQLKEAAKALIGVMKANYFTETPNNKLDDAYTYYIPESLLGYLEEWNYVKENWLKKPLSMQTWLANKSIASSFPPGDNLRRKLSGTSWWDLYSKSFVKSQMLSKEAPSSGKKDPFRLKGLGEPKASEIEVGSQEDFLIRKAVLEALGTELKLRRGLSSDRHKSVRVQLNIAGLLDSVIVNTADFSKSAELKSPKIWYHSKGKNISRLAQLKEYQTAAELKIRSDPDSSSRDTIDELQKLRDLLYSENSNNEDEDFVIQEIPFFLDIPPEVWGLYLFKRVAQNYTHAHIEATLKYIFLNILQLYGSNGSRDLHFLSSQREKLSYLLDYILRKYGKHTKESAINAFVENLSVQCSAVPQPLDRVWNKQREDLRGMPAAAVFKHLSVVEKSVTSKSEGRKVTLQIQESKVALQDAHGTKEAPLNEMRRISLSLSEEQLNEMQSMDAISNVLLGTDSSGLTQTIKGKTSSRSNGSINHVANPQRSPSEHSEVSFPPHYKVSHKIQFGTPLTPYYINDQKSATTRYKGSRRDEPVAASSQFDSLSTTAYPGASVTAPNSPAVSSSFPPSNTSKASEYYRQTPARLRNTLKNQKIRGKSSYGDEDVPAPTPELGGKTGKPPRSNSFENLHNAIGASIYDTPSSPRASAGGPSPAPSSHNISYSGASSTSTATERSESDADMGDYNSPAKLKKEAAHTDEDNENPIAQIMKANTDSAFDDAQFKVDNEKAQADLSTVFRLAKRTVNFVVNGKPFIGKPWDLFRGKRSANVEAVLTASPASPSEDFDSISVSPDAELPSEVSSSSVDISSSSNDTVLVWARIKIEKLTIRHSIKKSASNQQTPLHPPFNTKDVLLIDPITKEPKAHELFVDLGQINVSNTNEVSSLYSHFKNNEIDLSFIAGKQTWKSAVKRMFKSIPKNAMNAWRMWRLRNAIITGMNSVKLTLFGKPDFMQLQNSHQNTAVISMEAMFDVPSSRANIFTRRFKGITKRYRQWKSSLKKSVKARKEKLINWMRAKRAKKQLEEPSNYFSLSSVTPAQCQNLNPKHYQSFAPETIIERTMSQVLNLLAKTIDKRISLFSQRKGSLLAKAVMEMRHSCMRYSVFIEISLVIFGSKASHKTHVNSPSLQLANQITKLKTGGNNGQGIISFTRFNDKVSQNAQTKLRNTCAKAALEINKIMYLSRYSRGRSIKNTVINNGYSGLLAFINASNVNPDNYEATATRFFKGYWSNIPWLRRSTIIKKKLWSHIAYWHILEVNRWFADLDKCSSLPIPYENIESAVLSRQLAEALIKGGLSGMLEARKDAKAKLELKKQMKENYPNIAEVENFFNETSSMAGQFGRVE